MTSIQKINDQMFRASKAEAVALMARSLVMAAGGRLFVPNSVVEASMDIMLEERISHDGVTYVATWKKGRGPGAPKQEVLPPEPKERTIGDVTEDYRKGREIIEKMVDDGMKRAAPSTAGAAGEYARRAAALPPPEYAFAVDDCPGHFNRKGGALCTLCGFQIVQFGRP